MDGHLLKTIDELGVTVVSSQASARDEELVAAAKGGDELAFETIVKRHRQRISAVALRYTRSREDAEDIVQQTFQRAFSHLQSFEGRSSFSTWLTSIVINQALMLLRGRKALREVPIDDPSNDEGTTPALEMPDASPDPERNYLQQEEARVLAEAIGQLGPAMRTAVELTGLRELSMLEAGRHGDFYCRSQKQVVPREKETERSTETQDEITSDVRRRHFGCRQRRPAHLSKSLELRLELELAQKEASYDRVSPEGGSDDRGSLDYRNDSGFSRHRILGHQPSLLSHVSGGQAFSPVGTTDRNPRPEGGQSRSNETF